MKQSLFLTLFLIALLLSACASSPTLNTPELPLDPQVDNTWLPEITRQPISVKPAVEQTIAAISTPTQTPTIAPAVIQGTVQTDALNLRLGPGLTHQVLGLLHTGTILEVTGRSEKGDWLQVKLSNGVSGWVYAQYVQMDGELASLPVREAYGGPYPTTDNQVQLSIDAEPLETNASRENPAILVVIKDNIAEVSVKGFPAKSKLDILLRMPGASSGLVVGRGESSNLGKAIMSFQMPFTWADGTPLATGELVLEVIAVESGYTQAVIIEYYR